MQDRDFAKLQELGFSAEVISKTDEVLRIWEIDRLFVECSYCGKLCYNPELPGRRFKRKKLPSELFWNQDLLGWLDVYSNKPICEPCEAERSE